MLLNVHIEITRNHYLNDVLEQESIHKSINRPHKVLIFFALPVVEFFFVSCLKINLLFLIASQFIRNNKQSPKNKLFKSFCLKRERNERGI